MAGTAVLVKPTRVIVANKITSAQMKDGGVLEVRGIFDKKNDFFASQNKITRFVTSSPNLRITWHWCNTNPKDPDFEANGGVCIWRYKLEPLNAIPKQAEINKFFKL